MPADDPHYYPADWQPDPDDPESGLSEDSFVRMVCIGGPLHDRTVRVRDTHGRLCVADAGGRLVVRSARECAPGAEGEPRLIGFYVFAENEEALTWHPIEPTPPEGRCPSL